MAGRAGRAGMAGRAGRAGRAGMAAKPRLPIVYVRGFAGGTAGINSAVMDPFYGFNAGSTHVRVGHDEKPFFYQFESPLLRLHLDEGYQIFVEGGQSAYLERHDHIDPASIWIHRFYDASAGTLGANPEEFRLERAAESLLDLIEKLQDKTGAERVQLVAHSMGGLICRCLLQKIIPEKRPGRAGTDFVDKVFTYGTPHGGIAFEAGFGLIERLRDTFGVNGADIFGPERMREYLTPRRAPHGAPHGAGGWLHERMHERMREHLTPGDATQGDGEWAPEKMPDEAFPRERLLCLIGTDPADYEVAGGLSSAAVGARSDGLVQIEKAYVPGAHRAYVHRSHSGRYGLVNSEEGYQNLRRFLFGDVKVQADLVGHTLPADDDDVTWQAEVQLSIRGLPVTLHERLAAHWCPVRLAPEPGQEAGACVPLATAFMSASGAPRSKEQQDGRNGQGGLPVGAVLRHVLHLRILSLRERNGLFRFLDHVEQAADFDDILIIDAQSDATPADVHAGVPRLWPAWNSQTPGAIRDHAPVGEPLGDEDPDAGSWVAHIPLPESAEPLLGSEARIRLTATPWS